MFVRRLQSSPLARGTGWMLLAQPARMLAQTAYFVLVARTLGVHEFGGLAAALAVIAILVPFAGWGAGNVLVMNVSRDPTCFPAYWGNALVAIAVVGPSLVALVVAAGVVVLPSLSWSALLLLGTAELVCSRVSDTAAQAFQAVERVRVSAQLQLVPHACRVVAAVGFVSLGVGRTVEGWAIWYLTATAVSATLSLVVTCRRLGMPRPRIALALENVKDGWSFALGLSSSSVHADIDKTMIARLGSFEATGIYAAAYRGVTFAFAPVVAALYAAYARFFRRGADGIRSSLVFARHLLPGLAGYAAAASVFLFVLAPAVPLVLGGDYSGAAGALRWLAPLPLLQTLGLLAGDALTGAGYQGVRSALQVGTVAANIALNLWLIPLYSWEGAAWATLASYSLLAAGLWAVSGMLAATEPRRVLA